MNLKSLVATTMILFLCVVKSLAQNSFIPTSHLNITDNKTTNLIFPYSVQSIDRGSADILVQQPRGTENIVQVKAGKPNFMQTNLSVITIDGKLYSFTVDYAAQPSQLNLVIDKENAAVKDSGVEVPVLLASGINMGKVQTTAQNIAAAHPAVHGKKDKHDGVQLQIGHAYINQDVFFFPMELSNYSNLSYAADNIKFTIKNRQKAKRTATQEMEIKPLYTYGDVKNIGGNDSAFWVIALPKFTLPDSKYLSVQILEKEGTRDLHLALKNRYIMKARAIGDSN
jgi:conjugative transposon TraN protein